jgi:hypothetical protein
MKSTILQRNTKSNKPIQYIKLTDPHYNIKSTDLQSEIKSTESQSEIKSTDPHYNINSTDLQSEIKSTESQSEIIKSTEQTIYDDIIPYESYAAVGEWLSRQSESEYIFEK